MSIAKKNVLRALRKKERVRYALKKSGSACLRITVFRSLKHTYAQIIDDQKQHTIASCSSREVEKKSQDKKTIAFNLGKELARRLLAIDESLKENVIFDRGQYQYHGRIEQVAAGLREGGLIF